MRPFRVFGNLYFVGTKPASAHLIDTGDGLVLLDSGYAETLYLVLDSIRELGYNPRELKYVLHSHGHIDHAGATRQLVELTGAKTAIGRADRDSVTGARDLSYAAELGMRFEGTFEPDLLLDDGDEIRLGNTVFRCLHTPGHTEGTMSWFFDVRDGERVLRAGTHGGVGMNSMRCAYLEKYGLPLTLREDFRAGLRRLRGERVDVFIGNHQEQCDTLGKYARILRGETDAFADPAAWPAFLEKCEQNLDALLASEEAASDGKQSEKERAQ